VAEPTNLGQLLLRAFRWFDESLIAALHAGGSPGGALPPQLSTATVLATSRAAVSSAVHDQVTSSISRPSP
jgi:hypothetical protein